MDDFGELELMCTVSFNLSPFGTEEIFGSKYMLSVTKVDPGFQYQKGQKTVFPIEYTRELMEKRFNRCKNGNVPVGFSVLFYTNEQGSVIIGTPADKEISYVNVSGNNRQ